MAEAGRAGGGRPRRAAARFSWPPSSPSSRGTRAAAGRRRALGCRGRLRGLGLAAASAVARVTARVQAGNGLLKSEEESVSSVKASRS